LTQRTPPDSTTSSVRKAGKFPEPGRDRLRGGPEAVGRRERRERVLEVVGARQGEVPLRQDRAARPGGLRNEGPIFDPRASGRPPAARERHPARARRDRAGGRVVGVDDGEIVGSLVLEDPQLGADVVIEAAVPVEVVRRDVRQDRDVRREAVDGLELEG
jgi:hypothetical protein